MLDAERLDDEAKRYTKARGFECLLRNAEKGKQAKVSPEAPPDSDSTHHSRNQEVNTRQLKLFLNLQETIISHYRTAVLAPNTTAESITLTPHTISINLLNAQESESCPTKSAWLAKRTISYDMEYTMRTNLVQAYACHT